MPIEFPCRDCKSILRVPDQHAGKHARCPNCQGLNLIPELSNRPNFDSRETFEHFPTQPIEQISNPEGQDIPGRNPVQSSKNANLIPHRGSFILALGLMALLCNFMMIPGILAWALGRSDLKKIDSGTMDPSGRKSTFAGMSIGIGGTILWCVTSALYLILIIRMAANLKLSIK